MLKNIPLVVPTHHPQIDEKELSRISISRASNPHVIFVIPQRNFNAFKKNYKWGEVISFDDKWFKSRESYNSLLLNHKFWDTLKYYSDVVICQTDAILLKNVDTLPRLGFAFIGSPWRDKKKCRMMRGKIYDSYKKQFFIPFRSLSVGNGGLSFRNSDASRQIVDFISKRKYSSRLSSGITNEDIVFSYFFKKFRFPIPNYDEANEIFMEQTAKNLQSIPNVYGFHALSRYNPFLESKILNNR